MIDYIDYGCIEQINENIFIKTKNYLFNFMIFYTDQILCRTNDAYIDTVYD